MILKLNDLLTQVIEKMKQVLATLNEYRVAKKRARQVGKRKASITCPSRDYKRVGLEVQQLKADKELLCTTTQELDLKSSSDRARASRTEDEVLETVKPQYIVLAMKLVCKVFTFAIAVVSELKHEFELPCEEWRRQGQQVRELFGVMYDNAGIVPVPPIIVVKSGPYFL